MTIQMRATEKCFPVVLFIMLYKVVLTFKFVVQIVKCDYIQMKAIEWYSPVALFVFVVQGGFNSFQVVNLWCPEKVFEQFDSYLFSTEKSVCFVKLHSSKSQQHLSLLTHISVMHICFITIGVCKYVIIYFII